MWKSSEISALIDGSLFGPKDNTFKNCVIDSRQVGPGSLFFAMPGKNTDGHVFIRQAWEAGASIVIASQEGYKNYFCAHIGLLTDKDVAFTVPPEKVLILVPDTAEALRKLAYLWLNELDAFVVAVTGSNGKTTTKDMIEAVLSMKYQVHKSPENFNTEIGLPLSILHAPRGTEVLVLEMGMRGPGQITQMCQICRPDIGVITNIGNTHIEMLGSQEAISQAKWELIVSLPVEGMAILNCEDSETADMTRLRGMCCQKILFGRESRYGDPQIRAYDMEIYHETGTRFKVECALAGPRKFWRGACDHSQESVCDRSLFSADTMSAVLSLPTEPAGRNMYQNCGGGQQQGKDSQEGNEGPVVVELSLPGTHNVINALAALAVGCTLNVPLQEGAQGLKGLNLSKMRLEFAAGIGGSTVINDTYNANPASMKASLGILQERAQGVTIAVLGDMFELGQLALSQHLVIGAEVASLGITYLVTVGSLAEYIAQGALENGLMADHIFHCQNHEEAAKRILELIRQEGPGSWILVKGSRGMEMEKISCCLIDKE